MTRLIADPFVQTGVLAVVGAIITRLLLRRYPAWRLVFQLVLFVALTILLHHYDIVPYEAAPSDTPIFERIFIATAKVIWWVNAAWLLTGCARVFLIFERRPREGRLIQDLVVGVIYLSAALSVVAYVFNAPVGTLIATSGVFAIILGLALQSTLADVFSGIALNFSKPYEVGDWIVLSDGTEGRVVETNWRATHLLNASNDLVVLPNSGLAKAQFTNLSSPNSEPWGQVTGSRDADHGSFRNLRDHANRAAQQQFDHADASAYGGDQVAGCSGHRVRAGVPRQGLFGGGIGQARGL